MKARNILYALIVLTNISRAHSNGNLNKLAVSLQNLAQQEELKIPDSEISENDIFEHFTGQNETTFKNTTNATIQYDKKTETYKSALKSGSTGPFTQADNGDFILINKKTEQKYNAGQFETYTHRDLVSKTKNITASKKGTFNVEEAVWENGTSEELLAYVDVIALQHKAATDGIKTTFLIASDYDGIEAVGGTAIPSIDAYITDYTQGPAASLGCFPGALLRLYSQIREDAQVATKSFDPQNPHIHMLKMFNLSTQNGYVYLNDMHDTNPELEPTTFVNTFLGPMKYQLSIMYHKNLEVPVKARPAKNKFIVANQKPEYSIDQIFSAGLSLGSYRESLINPFKKSLPDKSAWINNFADLFAQKILNDIYDASIRAAIYHKREVLYVWPMGCGVFGNKHLWVANALKKCKDMIMQSGLTVKLIIFRKNSFSGYENANEYNDFLTSITELVKETKGSYLSVSLDKNKKIVKTYMVEKK